MLEVAKLQPDSVTFAFDVYFQMETTFINTKKQIQNSHFHAYLYKYLFYNQLDINN
jgi:hypothetical protein